ncbi:hypothetical protein [Yoonia sp.]|uniref:hypothetical protein n=1 Tax=Yoonia sp. TaxID=2212373 RepID=UPI0023B5C3DA
MTPTYDELLNHKWGLVSIGLGACALVVTMVVMFGGPFGPQDSVGTSIGKIIGEISVSAFNTVRGNELPPPEAAAWDLDRILLVTGPILAILAIVTAIVSAFCRDPWRLPTYGAVLGIGAIAIQVIWWIVLIIAGALILVSIIENGPSFLE